MYIKSNKAIILHFHRVSLLVLCIIISVALSSCVSRSSELSKYENREIKSIEVKSDTESPLDFIIKESLDKKLYKIHNFVLIVKYDTQDIDPREYYVNQEAKFLERHLFNLLKRINQDLEKLYSLRVDFEGLYQQDENLILNPGSSEKTKILSNVSSNTMDSPFRPEVLQWKVLSYDGGTEYNYLTTVWQSSEKIVKELVGGVFSISISFINEKKFVGYRVNIRFTSYTTDFFRPQNYESEFIYKLR